MDSVRLLSDHIPGETPNDDVSELKVKGIGLRSQLNKVEAENIVKPSRNISVVLFREGKPRSISRGFCNFIAKCLRMFGDGLGGYENPQPPLALNHA